MKNAFHRQLMKEIEVWLAEGLIDAGQAESIRGRYESSQGEEIHWGKWVLSGLGAIVFGLGVILFFAYNWADMPKVAKLAVILAGLVTTHGAGYVIGGRPGSKSVGEALHLLGTMLFGAGIWLVSQIYHLTDLTPGPFLVWGLGALAMAWAIPSLSQAFLSLVLILIWNFNAETLTIPGYEYWGTLLILLGILPLAYRLRSGVLTFFAAGSLFIVFPVAAADALHELTVYLVLFMAMAYSLARFLPAWRMKGALGAQAQTRRQDLVSIPGLGALSALGQWIFFSMIFTASFQDALRFLEGEAPKNLLQAIFLTVPLFAVIASLAFAWKRLGGEYQLERVTLTVIYGVTLIFVFLLPFESLYLSLLIAWTASLLVLGQGVILVLLGSRRQEWQQVASGCLMVCAVTMARFADLFESLLARSAAFLVLGALLFAVGHYYQSFKKAKDEGEKGELTHA